MSPLATSLIICVILIGGALTGALLRRLVPERHLDTHTKDVVRLGCALIATIAGLVLGLLINSAKTSFDAQSDQVRQLTANVILLDHLLEQYGEQTRPIRNQLRIAAAAVADRIWNERSSSNTIYLATTAGAAVEQSIRSFTPANDTQRLYHSQAVQTINAILQARLTLFEQSNVRMPTPFLVVLVFWLFILFVSFSLFSPINPMAMGAIVVIALSASGAIFLILEMYQPFSGMMQIDSGPLRHALASLAP
jgi:Protein of unknown function (DUF4239)